MSANQGLQEKHSKAISALLSVPSIKAASEKIGMNERTLRRWLKFDTDFIEAYREAKHQTFDHAITKMQSVCGIAIETLEDVMQNRKGSAMARVLASRCILELSLKAYETNELEARMEELERHFEERGKAQ